MKFYYQVFDNFYVADGITKHKAVRSTLQQNSHAERMTRTLMDKVRCMMIQGKLPMRL